MSYDGARDIEVELAIALREQGYAAVAPANSG
jgi:Holliday junction resolvase